MTTQDLLHNWNDLPREVVRKGVERVGFRGDNAMCVMNWLTPGMTVFPHSHTFEQLVIIVQGRVRFHLGDEVVEGGPGTMIRIPAACHALRRTGWRRGRAQPGRICTAA